MEFSISAGQHERSTCWNLTSEASSGTVINLSEGDAVSISDINHHEDWRRRQPLDKEMSSSARVTSDRHDGFSLQLPKVS